MTTRTKAQLKAFVIRYEIPWYVITVSLYVGAILLLIFAFPDVSNLWVSIFVLVGGFTASVGAAASAIKSNDTTE